MRDVINPGGLKNFSASPLRVFSGAPKCPTTGATTIDYFFNILYRTDGVNGHLDMVPVDVHGNILDRYNPIIGKSFARWVVKSTLTVQNTISGPDKNGISFDTAMIFATLISNTNNNTPPVIERGILPDSAGNSWSQIRVQLSNGSSSKILTDPFTQWELDIAPRFTSYVGPDMAPISDGLDISSKGVTTLIKILPEQSEFCSPVFYPYFFNAGSWISTSNNFGQIVGVGGSPAFNKPQTCMFESNALIENLYPDSTVIANIHLSFIRILTQPLFTISLQNRTAAFTNLTFFNPNQLPVWDWDFGDGSSHSTLQNPPQHIYAVNGTYLVTLTVTDLTGATVSFTQFAIMALKAKFTFTAHPFGTVPNLKNNIIFTDQSIVPVQWDWDFGDGSVHGSTQNPTHVYPAGASFQVTLLVYDGIGGSDSVTHTVNT